MCGKLRFLLVVFAAAAVAAPVGSSAQTREQAQLIAQREHTEKELEAIAVVDRKVMVPMRDGIRLATDIYRPKNASGQVPTIFVRTPYNFNYWDIALGAPRDMSTIIDAVKRGYAYVQQNERGHFFSGPCSRETHRRQI